MRKRNRNKKNAQRRNGFSRRDFLKACGIAGAALCLPLNWDVRQARAAIPGGSLEPGFIPKYATPLVIPPAMPRTSKAGQRKAQNIEYYEIAVRQFKQHILPQSMGLPATTVWSYGSAKHPETFNYPAFTIEARWRKPVRVKWINDLKDPDGNFLPHLFAVDPTLHWANPPGGTTGRDARPVFSSAPGPYTGPVPMVPHLHGAVGVGDESDGYAQAWFLPNANNIPAGYATEGSWYGFFKDKALRKFRTAWTPGSSSFQYPNNQRASTLWYHDHSLGMTRLNVYAGPAGFYLLRGGPDDKVSDTRTGGKALLPGPAPTAGSNPFGTFYEIPLAIQDRSFNADGSLFYPDTREFFDGFTGPYLPGGPGQEGDPDFVGSDISPYWNPEFFGNTMVVNGRTWPFLEVEQRRYRFRLLNGCNSRFLVLQFEDPHAEVWQIGNEGGFLSAPIRINDLNVGGLGGAILLGPAERADIIVDFSNLPAGTSFRLLNFGPDEPFGGFPTPAADPLTTGQVMEFRVIPATGADQSTPPCFLKLPAIRTIDEPEVIRQLSLNEKDSQVLADTGPESALLGSVDLSMAGMPIGMPMMWMDTVTENPEIGATETWEIYNFTEDAHPIHLHEVHFGVVDREIFDPMIGVTGTVRPPEAWESGFKDTVIAYPGEITRIKAKFDHPGQFVWHCHIVEHEDNEMMRPYRIGPVQPGEPNVE